uniref:AAA+ ATPase domain-containing protein n=1 Tax=Compsopogon caeruleus TaxID=31354 RepID=A0A7S1TFP8_9RHOD|mmetsp:Transcript_5123/g.10391  ORF Transcript_5123/g.10391 Transcript_5123/m.10391 type:complete len:732 (+) Transcript_5123:105-2300(+)
MKQSFARKIMSALQLGRWEVASTRTSQPGPPSSILESAVLVAPVSFLRGQGWALGDFVEVERSSARSLCLILLLWPSSRKFSATRPTAWVDHGTAAALGISGSEYVDVVVRKIEPDTAISRPQIGFVVEQLTEEGQALDGDDLWRLASVLKRILVDRVVGDGNVFALRQRGSVVRVRLDLGSERMVRVSENTVFRPSDPDCRVGQPQLKLRPIGGLEKELKEVLALVHAGARGCVLYGPPGTGKTLLASHVALMCAKGAMVVVSAAEIVGVHLGESEENLRQKFLKVEATGEGVMVLDEIDALAPRRDSLDALSGTDTRLTASLLSLLDGLPQRVFVIGTTNRSDAIDPAILRAGRLGFQIEIPPPSPEMRCDILRSIALASSVEVDIEVLERVGSQAHGYVGADLSALWREAVTQYFKESRPNQRLLRSDFDAALRRTRPSALREVLSATPDKRFSWDMIGGNSATKKAIQEVVRWSLDPASEWASWGIRPPRGVLLYGPPGCSKTLLARAVAAESNINFVSVKGPELLSKWVGESEKAVRALFRRAQNSAPALLFFDELDAIASRRAGGSSGGGAEDRVVAQLLTELDGVEALDDRVIIIGATNRPDLIDPALLRPGRIDRLLYVGLPDSSSRAEILRVHLRSTPVGADVDLSTIADEMCDGMSGAEIAALAREACLCAMEANPEDADLVLKTHFMEARQRIVPRTPTALLELYKGFRQGSKRDIFLAK